MLWQQAILPFALFEIIFSAGINKEHVIRLFATFQYQDAYRYAGGEKQVGGQADHGVDMTVVQQFGANALFRAATEQHAVWKDDRHHAAVTQPRKLKES